MSEQVLWSMLMFLSGLGCGLVGALVIVGRPAVKDGYRVVKNSDYIDLIYQFNKAIDERSKAEDEVRSLQREKDLFLMDINSVIDKWQPDQKEV